MAALPRTTRGVKMEKEDRRYKCHECGKWFTEDYYGYEKELEDDPEAEYICMECDMGLYGEL